jgi:antitoxin (DNA-binding transcriptional repressor) of toxin-antitoxin stability system
MVTLIGIGQFRGATIDYIERVAAGERFTVVRRRQPAAELRLAQDTDAVAGSSVTLSVLRSRAAEYFDRVKAGETIAIHYRGVMVAFLFPIASP